MLPLLVYKGIIMSYYEEFAIVLSPEADKQFVEFVSKHINKEIRHLLVHNTYICENKKTGSKLYYWDFINNYLIDNIINFLETLDTDLYQYIYVIDEYNEIKEGGSYSDDNFIMYPVTYIYIEDKE